MIARPASLLVATFLLAGCSSSSSSSPPPAAPTSAPPVPTLAMSCADEGSPTVVLETSPDVVAQAISVVVDAVRASSPLASCRAAFTTKGERCLEPTA